MEQAVNDQNLSGQRDASTIGASAEKKASFANLIYSSDSLTACTAFISEIKSHGEGENIIYFARLGLIQGTEKNNDGDYKRRVGNNVDLLVGRTLSRWAAANLGTHLKSLIARVKIRNLEFMQGEVEGKVYLNNRGILETVAFGHLEQ